METKLIDFQGGQILGVKDENDKIWMGVKKVCEDVGLSKDQSKNEVKKIQENLLFIRHNSVKKLSVKFDTQIRETICIEEHDVPMWLGQIALTPAMKKNNPIAVEKLLNYQDEAADVLHNAFMATEEQKQEFYDELGLKGKIVELTNKVDISNNKIVELNDRVLGLIDNSTINSRQSQKLLACARDKVRELLGDAHSIRYKKFSRIYFKNLWNNFCDQFKIGSYKDLNPLNYQDGFKFIEDWEYVDVK